MARVPFAQTSWTTRALLERVCIAVVTAIALWYWLRYFDRSTNLLDEGSQAAQALRLLRGEVIYRDFFTVVTPGSYYTIAALFQAFGSSLMVMRWAALALGLGIFAATLIVGRSLMTWPFAAAAALMTSVWGWFLVTPNFYSLQAAFLSLCALACYVRAARTTRPSWIVAAGILAGLTVLVKQNVGAYTVVALLVTIWLSRVFHVERNIRQPVTSTVRFASGVAIPVIPTLVVLVASGAGPYLYESWVYYPLAKYPERFALPFPAFYPVLPELGLTTLREAVLAWARGGVQEPLVYDLWTKVVLYLPLVVYPAAFAAVVVIAFRARSRESGVGLHGHILLSVSIFGLFALLQAWPRADVTHILFGLQATFVLLAYVLFLAWQAFRVLPGMRIVHAGALIAALLPLLVLLWYGYRRTEWEYQNYIVPLRVDRGLGIRASGIEAERINKVTAYIAAHTTPDDPIFVVPWASGFYFLTDRPNPTRTDFMLFEDPESYPCVLSRLERNPPKYVIYGYVWDVDGRHFRDYARPIDEYIRSRYAIEAGVDGYEVWRRIDAAGPARNEWPAACAPRRLRMRDILGSNP